MAAMRVAKVCWRGRGGEWNSELLDPEQSQLADGDLPNMRLNLILNCFCSEHECKEIRQVIRMTTLYQFCSVFSEVCSVQRCWNWRNQSDRTCDGNNHIASVHDISFNRLLNLWC